MKALILAAGRGSRLKGFTEDRPKSFNMVGDKRLIDYQLKALQLAGIKEIAVGTGYLAELFSEFNVERINNERWNQTNMVQTLLCAKNYFTTDVIISYSDIIYSEDTVLKLMKSKHDASIVYDSKWLNIWEKRFDNPLSDAESFKIDETSKILEIGKKTEDINEIEGQYIGLMKFSPKFMNVVFNYCSQLAPEKLDKLDMTSLLQRLIEQGEKLYGVEIQNNWFEVDTTKDLALVNQMFEEKNLSFLKNLI